MTHSVASASFAYNTGYHQNTQIDNDAKYTKILPFTTWYLIKMTKQAHVLNSGEIRRLFKHIATSKHAKRDTLLILISFGLGLRAVEMAALKLNQFFSKEGSIHEEILLIRTKGNEKRTVYLPSYQVDRRIHDALKDYYDHRLEHAEKKRIPFNLSQPLFLSQKGGAFTNRTLQKHFETLYSAASIKGASSHSGRRTFATRLIESGADIKAVSKLMGHAHIGMTAKYIQDNPDRLKKISSTALNFL